MKKKVVAFAASIGVVSSSALADDVRWISVLYRDRTQTTISCGAGAMCEVTLERGERLLGGEFVGEALLSSSDGAAETGQYELWSHSSMYEGEGVQQTPHLTFVASKPGLTADAATRFPESSARRRQLARAGRELRSPLPHAETAGPAASRAPASGSGALDGPAPGPCDAARTLTICHFWQGRCRAIGSGEMPCLADKSEAVRS